MDLRRPQCVGGRHEPLLRAGKDGDQEEDDGHGEEEADGDDERQGDRVRQIQPTPETIRKPRLKTKKGENTAQASLMHTRHAHVCQRALPKAVLVEDVHLGGLRIQLHQRLDALVVLVLHGPLERPAFLCIRG